MWFRTMVLKGLTETYRLAIPRKGKSWSRQTASNPCLCTVRGLRLTFIVYQAVPVEISQSEHFADVLLARALAKLRHDEAQLMAVDVPVAVHVEDAECLQGFLVGVRVLGLLGGAGRPLLHHQQELVVLHKPVVCADRTMTLRKQEGRNKGGKKGWMYRRKAL